MTGTPTTYGLLGMLAVRSWTGYELTQQVRRSLRFVWPVSEGHLYREQRRLVELGWATVEREPAGRRQRNRYAVTESGRHALREWLATTPEEPHLQIEGLLRSFYADQGTAAELSASLVANAAAARSMVRDLLGFIEEYLEPEGPLALLEQGIGRTDDDRREFHGRTLYPERLHAVALTLDLTTQLMSTIDRLFTDAAQEVGGWESTIDESLVPATRARLEKIRARGVGD